MSTPGYETRIAFGDASTHEDSTNFTEFAAVVEITPPTLEADDIETSHMTTPKQIRTFMPGWADAGEAEMSIEFDKSEARKVYDLFRIPKGFRIQFNDAPAPSGSKLFFDGYIKSVGHEVDREDRVVMPITIKVSGEPVFEEAA